MRAATWGRPYEEITNHPGRAGLGPAPTAEMNREHWFGRARRCCGTAAAAIFANPGPSGPGGIADSHSIFARRKFNTEPKG